jgi:hypothetical protein
MYIEEEIKEMVGQTVRKIENECIVTDECKFEFYHRQDCCESVGMYAEFGKLEDLVGQKIVDAFVEFPDDEETKEKFPEFYAGYYDSYTWTKITIKGELSQYVAYWLGESNGYYSESVDIKWESV